MSTTPANIGLISIDWADDGRAGKVETHRVKDRSFGELVDRIAATCRTEWWAIDVPFGWPMGFAEFLSRHTAGPAGLAPATGAPSLWAPIARRLTDLTVRDGSDDDKYEPITGFSVSFDKLGATAAAWSQIEYQLSDRGIKIDRAGYGDDVRIAETYPAAAWRQWVKGKNPAKTETTTFAAHLKGIVDLTSIQLNEHQRDAVVAALVARARSKRYTRMPSAEQMSRARVEGWIHLPERESLRQLTSSASEA